jgi:superfamily I DNA/RNA helicase
MPRGTDRSLQRAPRLGSVSIGWLPKGTGQAQALLKSLGIEHVVLDKSKEGTGGGVRLATMHRVKGLEFLVMILAGVNSKVMPLRLAAVECDPTGKKQHEDHERSLFFVAATRARDQLIVTSWATPSQFLAGPGMA